MVPIRHCNIVDFKTEIQNAYKGSSKVEANAVQDILTPTTAGTAAEDETPSRRSDGCDGKWGAKG